MGIAHPMTRDLLTTKEVDGTGQSQSLGSLLQAIHRIAGAERSTGLWPGTGHPSLSGPVDASATCY